MPNRLIHETSPYLLQHAHNPVDWFPWGQEALEKAKAEDKPIIISIGYAACHWCHVMERESFEDEATAQIMNKKFICIKIDREERPDLDHIYMDALQAMTKSGGWPLNVFLTPDTKPFYGGTYFPPEAAYNRPSWQQVLHSVAQAFVERRQEIETQAENLTAHLQDSGNFSIAGLASTATQLSSDQELVFTALMAQADRVNGGFGQAPKFPQTFSIQWLLRHYHFYKNEEALQQALLSLDKIIGGGIYDQAGGGFARYATDEEWLVPHFEKMLYDNALLIAVLAEACSLTRKERYREIIIETIDFLQREMLSPEGGFYTAIDADSEGEEGKFYVWEKREIEKILENESAIFCEYYNITEAGNWDEKNILWVKDELASFCNEKKLDLHKTKTLLENGRKKLLLARNLRVRPQLDDKILLGWNALMNTALSKAFAATGKESYRQLAIKNMDFLLDVFATPAQNIFHHTYKNNQAKYPAFLDDYAYLIQALLQLQEITADTGWLDKAAIFTGEVIKNFSDKEHLFFFYTTAGQTDILLRKKEIYDGAIPSANAVMAQNLYQLGLLFDKTEWKDRSRKMLTILQQAITKHPASFGCWAALLQQAVAGTHEIAIVGKDYQALQKELLTIFIPNKILMAAPVPASYPLLRNKQSHSQTLIWLCTNNTCLTPVSGIEELILQLEVHLP